MCGYSGYAPAIERIAAKVTAEEKQEVK